VKKRPAKNQRVLRCTHLGSGSGLGAGVGAVLDYGVCSPPGRTNFSRGLTFQLHRFWRPGQGAGQRRVPRTCRKLRSVYHGRLRVLVPCHLPCNQRVFVIRVCCTPAVHRCCIQQVPTSSEGVLDGVHPARGEEGSCTASVSAVASIPAPACPAA
jgi:hypothetical protein